MITPPAVYNNADDLISRDVPRLQYSFLCAVRIEGLILLPLEHHWTMTIKTGMMMMLVVVVGIKC